MRRILLSCISLVVAVWAHAQALDPTDPAAVAKAYLDACDRGDLEAAAKVSADEQDIEALRRIEAKPPAAYLQQLLGEALCAALVPNLQHAMGVVTYSKTGDECRVKAAATYSRPITLILKKDERGEWRVALWESLQESGGQPDDSLPGSILIEDLGASEQQTCMRHLKLLALAVLMYAQDHDEVLPPAESWRDDLLPYVQSTGVFVCPANPWGYAYNSALAMKPLAQIERPADTIALFEVGHTEPNMAADPTKVGWARRHNGGDDAAYVDGHVKWSRGQ